VMGSIEETSVEKLEQIEELKGNMASQDEEDKFMHSVLQNNKDRIDEGKIVNEAINQGLQSFNPDMMFSQMVNNYQLAEQIHGERLIQLLSGYSPDYIKKNIRIPEFQRELQLRLKERKDKLVDEGIIGEDGRYTEKGIDLASLILYMDELENLVPRGNLGVNVFKKITHYGERHHVRNFRTTDRFRDIAIRDSIKLAVRRGHKKLGTGDLKTVYRKSKGSVQIIYGLDASGSMKGNKLGTAKKAGIALAFQAINRRDKVGLVIFKNDAQDFIEPTLDFRRLLTHITRVTASRETNFTAMIRKAIEMFGRGHITKHLVILTDALPTVGDDPEKDALHIVSEARSCGISISIVGINLDGKGEVLAKKLATLGDGRLYNVSALKDVDKLILHDYYTVVSR